MGCVNSRADINDLHPNIFQVMNVDDLGNLITPGRLEVTESDIVLYQRGKQAVYWPLRCLRRYGYDSEIFSFESGRRCSTGPGIYAFKCRRADQLFNLVQTNIQVCNNGGDDVISRDLSIPSHSGSTITRMTIQTEPNYLDPTPIRSNGRINTRFSHSQQNGIARLSSVGSSSGPISPQGTISSPSPPPIPILPLTISQSQSTALYANDEMLTSIEMENNNNKSLHRRTIQRSRTMSSTISNSNFLGDLTLSKEISHNKPPPLTMASYMNVDISDSNPHNTFPNSLSSTPLKLDPETENIGHAYMNINPGQDNVIENPSRNRLSTLTSPQSDRDDNSRHCYANLEPKEVDNLRIKLIGLSTNNSDNKTVNRGTTPPVESIKEVNYAVLDLDKNDVTTNSSSDTTATTTITTMSTTTVTNECINSAPSPPESPSKPQKGYATIDFNKTAALSHSVNPNVVNDNEGSRKTRHNSTINDLNTSSRQNSSISE